MIQETFAEFDVSSRDQLVRSRHQVRDGEFLLSDEPGLGVELELDAIAAHPYVAGSFPSLWDSQAIRTY